MNKLCIGAGVLVFSTIGGMIPEALGWGFGWSIVLSGIGSMVGVYVGWKVARRFD